MALWKLNEGEVKSDAGFRVRVGHSRLTYFEAGETLSLDAEHMTDGTLVVYGFGEGGPSEVEERSRILSNIRDALSFLGSSFDIEERV